MSVALPRVLRRAARSQPSEARAVDAGAMLAKPATHAHALVALIRRTLGASPATAWRLVLPDGASASFSDGAPAFTVTARDRHGVDALRSLDELRICEAYMDQHLDLDGDLRAAVALRDHLSDGNRWITLWRRLEPLLLGRRRARVKWVRQHYDAGDIQLAFVDEDFHVYTQGAFESAGDTLEIASARKLGRIFAELRLRDGHRVLDVGFGWGPFVRYAGRRRVHVTGLTLSRKQHAYVSRQVVERERIDADLRFEDFFAHAPTTPYDAIVACGVIEELADYDAVMARLARWLVPGGRAYLDFSSAAQDFVLPAFISKHVFPGSTSRVHLPKLVAAVTCAGLELRALHEERDDYRRTTELWYERFEERRDAIRAHHGERAYRLFRLYLAANPVMLGDPSRFASAYRMIVERPDHARRP